MLACVYSKCPINTECFIFQPGLQALLLIFLVSQQKRRFSSHFNASRLFFYIFFLTEKVFFSLICNSRLFCDQPKFTLACAISRCKLHNKMIFFFSGSLQIVVVMNNCQLAHKSRKIKKPRNVFIIRDPSFLDVPVTYNIPSNSLFFLPQWPCSLWRDPVLSLSH